METLSVEISSAKRARWFCDNFLHGTRPRFLFGRNRYALSVAAQVDIAGFIDDFTTDARFADKPIVKLDTLPPDALVVNCVAVGRPITAQRRLESRGCDHLDYYSFLKHSGIALEPIEYWIGFPEHFEQNAHRYTELYRTLSDPLSKEVLSRIVTFRRTYDLDCMRTFSDTQVRQYFEPFVEFGDREIFADIGAFDGITSQEFARRCPDYAGIYVFEPSEANLAAIRQKLPDDPRICLVPVALGAHEGTVRFDPAGSSSRVAENGSAEVRVITLDSLRDVRFTFLKMDVEGAEASVVEGAKDVIKAYHPNLAISVYHHPGDMVDIPRQVLEIRDDYELRLRHYTEGFTETVMYFLPKP